MQNIVDIGSLITQGKILKTADIDPDNDYAILQKWRPGNRKRGADIGAYESFAIPLSELLGGGSTYTASNGVVLVANDIQLASGVNSKVWAPDGNSFGSEKFLGTIDNFALPIRINNVEVARFTTGGDLALGLVVPTARLHIQGASATSADYALKIDNSASAPLLHVRNDKLVSINQAIDTSSQFAVTAATGLNAVIGTTDSGYGIIGSATTGVGVRGVNASGYGIGVDAFSTNNVGVSGQSTNGIGGQFIAPISVLAKGIDSTSANYSFQAKDVANTLLVYVRNDGAFSTKYGVWIDGIKKMWTDNTFLHTVFWNHSNASALTTGSSRNTLVGNSDSNQPQITSGGFNSVFGTFAGMNITSGNYNLVLGNYNMLTPGGGSRNINMGQGGMSNAAADETFTINGFSSNSNEVVFGSEVYARYSNWWFGQGKELNTAAGRFNMNWNATSSLTGQIDSAAMITEWVFNGSRGTGTGAGGDFVWKVATAGVTGSTLNPLVTALRIRQTGGIAAPLLQTGNAGLVTGDLYVDTAANILANGDRVVGRKV